MSKKTSETVDAALTPKERLCKCGEKFRITYVRYLTWPVIDM